MKRNKSGISLITLVITIIIMIILAGAIILTLTNSGIFDKANDAVSEYDLKQVQAIADLAWSEAYADGARDKDSLQAAVDKALTVNKLNDKYKAEADEKGVVVTEKVQSEPSKWVREYTDDEVPIPVGFVASPYGEHDGFKAENTKNGGLVIYALTPDEIAEGETDILKIDGKNGELTLKEAHYVSMETRNQFVWVPVDDFKGEFKRDGFGSPLSSTLGSRECWELLLDEDNKPSTIQNTKYVSATTLTEATEMYNSVAEYGGFYIARYEVGKDDAGKTSITMGKYPYNYVAWGRDMVEDENDNGAVSQARAFYTKDDNNYGAVSTLTYGVQWDTTLNWWTDINLEDSTSYGNHRNTSIEIGDYNENAQYSDDYGKSWKDAVAKEYDKENDEGQMWLLTTGAFKKANVNNIYDMAGNLYEWTMEGNSNDCESRVHRGGSCGGTGAGLGVTYRYYYVYLPHSKVDCIGFRPSLYIKY